MLTRDQREVHRAYERVAFNVVLHNRDDHARNVGFRLGRDRRWMLAPPYDLTFSPGPGGEHAMDVCGHGKEVSSEHPALLAQQGGLDAAWAAAAVERIAEAACTLAAQARSWPIRKATLHLVICKVEENRRRLVR